MIHSNNHPLEHDSKVSVIGKAGNLKAQLSTSAMTMIFLKHYLTTLDKETMSNLFSSFLIVCILRPWIIWSCICK